MAGPKIKQKPFAVITVNIYLDPRSDDAVNEELNEEIDGIIEKIEELVADEVNACLPDDAYHTINY